MCHYRYHYYSSCRHQTFTVFSLCENATLFTSPVRTPRDRHGDTRRAPPGDQGNSPSSRPSKTQPRPGRGYPTQNKSLAANPRQSSVDTRQDRTAFPDSCPGGENFLYGDVAKPNALPKPPKLTQKQLESPTPGAVTVRDILADIPGYDHSWVEHYPLPPHIRTRTQSQEGFPTEGRDVGQGGKLSPEAGVPRVSSMPLVLDIAGVENESHSQPAMGLLGSCKQAGASSCGVGGTYLRSATGSGIGLSSTSSPTQSTPLAQDGGVHGRLQAVPTTIVTGALSIREVHNAKGKGRSREHPPGKISGTCFVNIDRVSGVLTLRKSWADMVEEDDRKGGPGASGAGFQPSGLGQGDTGVTNGGVSRSHERIQEGIIENRGTIVGQSLVRPNLGPQASNTDQDAQSDRTVFPVDRRGRPAASARQAYATVNQVLSRARISVIADHTGHSNLDNLGFSSATLPVARNVMAEGQSGTTQQGAGIGTNVLNEQLRSGVPSTSPESSPVLSQSTSIGTEPFPNFDDSHFAQLQTTDSSPGNVVRLEDASGGTGNDRLLLPHERLTALSGPSGNKSERNRRQLERDLRYAQSQSTGKNWSTDHTAKINRYFGTKPETGSEQETGYILLGSERLEMPTHMLSISRSASEKSPQVGQENTSRSEKENTQARSRADQVRCSVDPTLHLKNKNGNGAASLGSDGSSKEKQLGFMEMGHFPGLEAHVSSYSPVPDLTRLDISCSEFHMNPVRDSSGGIGGRTAEMRNQQMKENLPLIGDDEETDDGKTLERGGSANTATPRYRVSANPASQQDVLAQALIPRVDSSMEISGAPEASSWASQRWAPARTAIAMAPASSRNWTERSGQASDFEPVIRLQTPGFDLSTMSFAERLRAPSPRDPLSSTWTKSRSELENVNAEPTSVLPAIPRCTSSTESPSHIGQAGPSVVQRRRQCPNTGTTVMTRQEDMVTKPGKVSKTKVNKVMKINNSLGKEKQEEGVGKQVVQLPKRRKSVSNRIANEQGSSRDVSRNKASAEKPGDMGKIDRIKAAVAIPRIDFTQPLHSRSITAKREVVKTPQGGIQIEPGNQIEAPKMPDEETKTKTNEHQRKPRSATMIPGPVTPGGTLRSDRVTARNFGVISPLKTYKMKVTTPEWSEIASSTSSLVTFTTAPESPILPWSPNQDHWNDQSPAAPQFVAPDLSLNDSYAHSTAISTTSDTSDRHMVSLREADNSPATTITESPSTLTEKAGEGEYLAMKMRVGDTELSAEFLLCLVSELSPESYKDVYQKHPSELELLLRLRGAPKAARTITGSSTRTIVPQPTPSMDLPPATASAHATERRNSKNIAEHEATLIEARHEKKNGIALPREALDAHRTKRYADQRDQAVPGQQSEGWPGPQGQLERNPEVFQSETPFAYQLYGYLSQPELVRRPKSHTVNQTSMINSSEPQNDQELYNNANPANNDSAIIAQGQIPGVSGGRKPTKRYARKKHNRHVGGDGPSPASRQDTVISESAVPKEFMQPVQGLGPLVKGYYSTQAGPLESSLAVYYPPILGETHNDSLAATGHIPMIEPYTRSTTSLHRAPVHYNSAHLSSVPTPFCSLPPSIPNNIAANSLALQAWPNLALVSPPTIWMDYYGKVHSHKPAYPKCKWVGNEMKIPPKSEGVLAPGWTSQAVPELRNKHTHYSRPRARSYRKSTGSHRSPERNAGGGGGGSGQGDGALVQSSTTQGHLPTRWVSQSLVFGQFGEPDVVRGAPHRPTETVTGFLPCKKGEVTHAVEDFVQKCPKCDPDYLHESDT